jgi:DNA-binding NtrC family response regulator
VTRAERALFAVVAKNGELSTAFGVDLDGFELSNAKARVEPGFLQALLASAHSSYQPDLEGGSRLGAHVAAAAGQRVVVLLEHRFRQGQFDALRAETLAQWLTLAQLAARVSASSSAPSEPAALAPETSETSTRKPVRASRRRFPEILGDSAALDHALQHLDAAIDSSLPALLVGETGAGKELFARALHEHGARADRPFVAVNCAAIADSLFEAELFGHARGAFTGADRVRAGLLARAEGGTLLLDEIGELSLSRQATLLRLLETRCYRAVGSDSERQVDVRFVAATNRALEDEVEHGRFRKDLLFRLNVLRIQVPALRERREDIALLTRELLGRAARPRPISDAALERLSGYDWPGNVRELQNVIGRLLALGGGCIDVPDLPRAIRAAAPRSAPAQGSRSSESSQREEVERALSQADGNITRAALLLGLTRHGLKKRMLRFGLRTRGESRG